MYVCLYMNNHVRPYFRLRWQQLELKFRQYLRTENGPRFPVPMSIQPATSRSLRTSIDPWQ